MPPRRKNLDVDPTALRNTALTFSLRKRAVSLDDFERFVHETRAALRSVSRAAASRPGDWVLTDLRYGSAIMSFAPTPSPDQPYARDRDLTQLVENAVIDGFLAVESATAKPSYFPDRALAAVRRLSDLAGDGTMEVTSPEGRKASLSAAASKNVDVLLRPARRYFGSILGNLDVLSVHRAPYVTVYGDHGDVVRCYMSPAQVDEAKDLLGDRVLAAGLITTNRFGNVVSIKVDDFYKAPRRTNRPLSETAGAIPDFTDGTSTEDYLTQMRRASV